MATSEVWTRQAPLREQYQADERSALIIDEATTHHAPGDACHSTVRPGVEYDVDVPVGVHRGVGGLHDAPNSGELLAAALASCYDTVIRVIADLMGVRFESLEVHVAGDVDLRGTLQMAPDVRAGFQEMRCDIRITPVAGTDPDTIERLLASAERSCVVGDTLRNGVPVRTTASIESTD